MSSFRLSPFAIPAGEPHPCEPDLATFFREAFGAVESWRLDGGLDPLFGQYRLHDSKDRWWFAKLRPPEQRNPLQRADAVARFLAGKGIETSTLLALVPFDGARAACCAVYREITGRMPQATPSDATQVGRALGQMHAALRDCPDAATIARRAHERLERLARPELIPSGTLPAVLQRFAAAHAEAWRRFAQQGLRDGQVIHGDAHPANMLLHPDGSLTFLDFEDAAHSLALPAADIARVIERLILLPHGMAVTAETMALTRRLREAYEQARRFPSAAQLADACRYNIVLSILILSAQQAEGNPVPAREIEKFLILINHCADETIFRRLLDDDRASP